MYYKRWRMLAEVTIGEPRKRAIGGTKEALSRGF
jgi:hypothetical protein